MKKKAEKLATHEDIDRVLDQVRAVTTTTKEIEAKISSEVWDRQKKWELKRDAIFAVMKAIAEVEEAMTGLDAIAQTTPAAEDIGWLELVAVKRDKWMAASARLSEARLLIRIVCGFEIAQAVDRFATLTNKIAFELLKNRNRQVYSETLKEVTAKLFAVFSEIRKELGVDSMFPPKSGGSSAPQVVAARAPE